MSDKDHLNNQHDREGEQPLAHGLAKPAIEGIETAGALLKHYRVERHIGLPELAAVLKVSPEKLAALESDQYEALPDMVFTRALAISMCRLMGADSAAVLAKLPNVNSPTLTGDASGLNKPFKACEQPAFGNARVGEGSYAPKVLWLVAGLLVAAVLVYFWPQIHSFISSETARNAQTQVGSELRSPSLGFANAGSEAGVQSLQVPGLMALQESGAGGSALMNGLEPLPAAMLQEPFEQEATVAVALAAEGGEGREAAAAPAAAVSEVAAPVDTLHITAQEPVWIQVRDGNNAIVHQSTLPKGRELAIANSPPLRVEIGRADAVQVLVNGQEFDLQPYSRRNVARFEVMP